jgi:hypothetical protein
MTGPPLERLPPPPGRSGSRCQPGQYVGAKPGNVHGEGGQQVERAVVAVIDDPNQQVPAGDLPLAGACPSHPVASACDPLSGARLRPGPGRLLPRRLPAKGP